LLRALTQNKMQQLLTCTALFETALSNFIKANTLQPNELKEAVNYILSLGGKRIRPTALLLSTALFKGRSETAMPLALATEVFHNFTLVHDDIMDNAPLRRGKTTLHEKWNNNTAILAGDVMMIMANRLLQSYTGENKEKIIALFNDTAIAVCEGQQADMNFETAAAVSISEYIQMIEQKTAVLLAASFQMGAWAAGCSANDANAMYAFGKNLGIAFQLTDDLLDVYGGEQFGKKTGGDIVSNKKTFLFLKAHELANPYEKEALLNWTQSKNETKKIAAVTAIYDQLEIKLHTSKKIETFYRLCTHAIDDLSLSDDDKLVLKELAQTIMSRNS
jgi:geranylgeranyl diphosphate synthase, type II